MRKGRGRGSWAPGSGAPRRQALRARGRGAVENRKEPSRPGRSGLEVSPQSGGGRCSGRLDALARQGPGPRQLRAQVLEGVGLTSEARGTILTLNPKKNWGRANWEG